MHKLFLLYLKDCFRDASTILVVCEGLFSRCISNSCRICWNISVNLGGLQADLKGGLGGRSPPQRK